MATYIDAQGFLTQDYTMDQADVAAAATGQTRRGIPTMGDDGGTGVGGALPTLTGNMATGGYNNYVANGWVPQAGGGYAPPAAMAPPVGAIQAARNVTSQSPAAAASTTAARPVPVGGMPAMMPGMDPQVAAATQNNAINNAINLAKVPVTDLATRASFVPGGSDLYNSLAASNHLGNAGQITPNSTLSGLTDADGKTVPINTLNRDMITDPRFQQLEKMDQINGTNNAATFYSNLNPGRTLAGDRAAAQAQMVAQNTVQTKDAAELAKNTTVATSFVKGTGGMPDIQPGDIVKQQVVPGLLPGQETISYTPLNAYEKELLNIMPNKAVNPATGKLEQVMDKYGRPSYSPQGNSKAFQATGMFTAADLQYAQGLQDRKNAQNQRAAATQAPAGATSGVAGVAPAGQATSLGVVDAGKLIYDNSTNTLGNLFGSIAGTPAVPYTTPQQRLADINRSAVAAASVWGNASRSGVTTTPELLADQLASQAPVNKAGPKFDPYLYQNDDNYLPPKTN